MDAAPASPPPAATISGYPTAATPGAKRPTGVTILGVLGIVFGALGILAGLAALAGGAFLGAMGGAMVGAEGAVVGGLVMVVGILALVTGALALVGGIGLLQGKRWGWYLAIVAAGLGLIQAIVSLISLDIFSALVGIALNGFIAWYLLSPAIQAWFGVSHNVPWKYKQAGAV